MIELFRASLVAQYEATLSMLGNAIARCPDQHWSEPVGGYPFWHSAYHCLFFVDLYLSPSESAFEPQAFHRSDYQFFGANADGDPVVADIPYERDELLGYVRHCRDKAKAIAAIETEESLAGACGFWWYSIPRAEFHLNNIRHAQHHAAQLSLHLRRAADTQIPWCGSGWKFQSGAES